MSLHFFGTSFLFLFLFLCYTNYIFTCHRLALLCGENKQKSLMEAYIQFWQWRMVVLMNLMEWRQYLCSTKAYLGLIQKFQKLTGFKIGMIMRDQHKSKLTLQHGLVQWAEVRQTHTSIILIFKVLQIFLVIDFNFMGIWPSIHFCGPNQETAYFCDHSILGILFIISTSYKTVSLASNQIFHSIKTFYPKKVDNLSKSRPRIKHFS